MKLSTCRFNYVNIQTITYMNWSSVEAVQKKLVVIQLIQATYTIQGQLRNRISFTYIQLI